MALNFFEEIDITSTGDDFYEAIEKCKNNWATLDALFSSISTLADEATPSISGGRHFVTGGTTTITDFDDGVTGQVIYIRGAHSVTITHGTNIFLDGGANMSMVAKDTLVLRCESDNKWYQLSESDNST